MVSDSGIPQDSGTADWWNTGKVDKGTGEPHMQRGTEQSGSVHVGSRSLYAEPDWLKAGDWRCPDEMGVAGRVE